MIRSFSMLKFRALPGPVRRVLALDAGSRRLKLLLVESDFGRLRLVKEELIDLQAEGLVSAEEVKTHLQGVVEEFGRPPLALALPQHLSISEVIDLPLSPESEVDKLIAGETVKLSGVSESRIVYDFVRTQTSAKDRQQFWVTLCQEHDIHERLDRLAIEPEDVCEVTTAANALINAYRATSPAADRAILVHLGAQTTVAAILVGGQGAFATSFQMGGDFFTRALARLRGCPEDQAEALKRRADLLQGPDVSAEFAAVVDGWVAELKRQLNEWFQKHPNFAAEVGSFPLIATGGGFDQPGLLPYLSSNAALEFKPWPEPAAANVAVAAKGFEIAYGTALQALGYGSQPVSLLPDNYRSAWQKRLGRQRVEFASLVLAAVCVLVLAIGTWHKLSLISAKKALLDKVQAAQEAADANELLTADLIGEYENIRPVFAVQQNTVDTLKTLGVLQQSRSNRNFWYVLLADQQSYFSRPPALLSTNRPARTNLLGIGLETSHPAPPPLRLFSTGLTNLALAKPGLIAELCVPGEADATRKLLGELVSNLKQQPLFSKVDQLSDDLRRSLADSKVVVTDRDYVLFLDFANTDFQQPVPSRKPPPSTSRGPRRAPRATSPMAEGGNNLLSP